MSEEQRRRNREQMPNVAAMLDQFRKSNPGLGFKVLWAKDLQTGVEVGKREVPDPDRVWPVPDGLGRKQEAAPTPSWQQTKRGRRK